MGKEIEMAYYGIDRDSIVAQLEQLKAEFLGSFKMRRVNFQVATNGKTGTAAYYTCWIRVRTDGNSSTITLKEQKGSKITGRYEYEVKVDNFDNAVIILAKALQAKEYDYFENQREAYKLGSLTFTIDKFPMLPYLLEIEGKSKKVIEDVLKKVKIDGEIDKNKSVPTKEYYRMHGVDYSIVQKEYTKIIEDLLGRKS